MSDFVGGLNAGLDFLVGLQAAELPTIGQLDLYLDDIMALFDAFGLGLSGKEGDLSDSVEVIWQVLNGELKRVGVADTFREYTKGLIGAMIQGITERLAALQEAVNGVGAKFTSLRWLPEIGYVLGKGWADYVAAGIWAGLPALQAAMDAMEAYFPQSPAKAGPFKKLPTAGFAEDWARDVAGALNMGVGSFNSLSPAFAGGGAAAGSSSTYNINVTATGGAEKGDTRRLAQDIVEEIRRSVGVR